MDTRPLALFQGNGLINICQTLVSTAAKKGECTMYESNSLTEPHWQNKHVPAVYTRLRDDVTSEFK